MKNQKNIIFFSTAILGAALLCGCGAKESNNDTTGAVTVNEISTDETITEPSAAEPSEIISTRESEESSETTSLVTTESEEEDEELETAKEITTEIETAPTPEYELTKPAAAGESMVFSENYIAWDISIEDCKEFIPLNPELNSEGKDLYRDLFASSNRGYTIKGTNGSCEEAVSVKVPENAVLSEYRCIESDEFPYFSQGELCTVTSDNYTLNVEMGYITYHYDDEGDTFQCAYTDVHNAIDAVLSGSDTVYRYNRSTRYDDGILEDMHKGWTDVILPQSVTDEYDIAEMILITNENIKTMYMMSPVEPCTNKLLQITLEDKYSDSAEKTNDTFIALCTDILMNSTFSE